MSGGSGDAFLHVSVLQRAGADTVAPGANLRVRVGPGQKGQQVTEVLEIKEGDAPPPPSRSFGAGDGGGGSRFSAPPPGSGEEMRGVVKWYNPQKGFGFVTPEDGGQDVFLHSSVLQRAGRQDVQQGEKVDLEVRDGQRGRQAVNLK